MTTRISCLYVQVKVMDVMCSDVTSPQWPLLSSTLSSVNFCERLEFSPAAN